MNGDMDRAERDQLRESVTSLYKAGRDTPGWRGLAWRRLTELQLTGIAVDTALGGGGGGLVEAGVVCEVRGHAADLGAYPETVGTSAGLAGAGADDLLRAVAAAGAALVPLRPAGESGDPDRPFCAGAPPTGGSFVDNGAPEHHAVWHDCAAGTLHWGPLSVVATVVPVAATSRQEDFEVRLTGTTPNTRSGPDVCARWTRIGLAVDTLRCAEIVGACRWLRGDAFDYAHQRAQFGRPIAQYQAVQHELATQLSWVDGAEMVVRRALAALAEGHGALEAARAGAFVREKAWQVLFASYNILGGVGFIEETPVNAYCRGILGLLSLLGPVSGVEERSAEFVRPGAWLATAGA